MKKFLTDLTPDSLTFSKNARSSSLSPNLKYNFLSQFAEISPAIYRPLTWKLSILAPGFRTHSYGIQTVEHKLPNLIIRKIASRVRQCRLGRKFKLVLKILRFLFLNPKKMWLIGIGYSNENFWTSRFQLNSKPVKPGFLYFLFEFYVESFFNHPIFF